ncbi:MAG: hypothetical protein PHU05_04065 [Bacilli bacterium]|nr:hypothetical protein [Bacilli bacterium]
MEKIIGKNQVPMQGHKHCITKKEMKKYRNLAILICLGNLLLGFMIGLFI